MARFLATRVIYNHLNYKGLPESIKETVKDELIKMGRDDLLVDEAPNV